MPKPYPLDNWNSAKEDTCRLLSITRSKLNSASISAKGISMTAFSFAIDCINQQVKTLMDDLYATRAPRFIVDETNKIIEEEKNDRLGRIRARKSDNISSAILRSEQHSIYDPSDWDRLSLGLALKAVGNFRTTQSPSEVAGEQIHTAPEETIASIPDIRICPSCHKVRYHRSAIGYGCAGCGVTLPNF